jgi:signal transduction histidine kinase
MIVKCIGLVIVLLLANDCFGQSVRSENVREFYEETCPYCSGQYNGNSKSQDEVELYKNYHSLHKSLESMDVYGATQSLRTCLQLNETINNDPIALKLVLIRGTLFDIFGLPTEELESLSKAKFKSLSQWKWKEYLESNIATAHIDIQEYSIAFPMLKKWYATISDSTPRDILKTNYFNLGQCYGYSSQFDSAMFFQQKSLELELLDLDTSGIVSSYMEIGNVFYEQYIDDSAHVYFKKAYFLAKKVYDIDLMKFTTLNMSVVEENAGNIALALDYRKEYDGIRDSLDSRDRLWTIAKEEKEFAVGLKNKEIALVEKEKAIKVKQLQSKKRERNLFLIATLVLAFFLVAIAFLFKRSISKKKIIEHQRLKLEELNRTKDLILSIVAHDLKSPVYHIVLNNNSLLNHFDKESVDEKYRELFDSNVELGNRTYQLIDNLLNWALCQNDQFFTSKTKIPLKKTVEHVVYNFQPLFTQKNIRFESEIDESINVYLDQNSLKIVLRNLLDNAMKFTHEGGEITIKSEGNEGDFVSLIVSDTGVGMSKKAIEDSRSKKVGQSKADTSGKASTGLGLNLCSIIIEKNDGEIVIESEEGKGTSVKLKLKRYGEN